MKHYYFLLSICVCFLNRYYVDGIDYEDIKIGSGTCNLPCNNGGICILPGVCECPQGYAGELCQFNKNVCAMSKPQFNGIYNCSKDDDECTVQCPKGMIFNFPPALKYICQYDTGKFLPEPLPQCEYPTPVEIDGDFFEIEEEKEVEPTFETNKEFTYLTTDVYNVSSKPHLIIERKQQPGSCFTWGGSHFKTFDGDTFSFNSPCAHILLRDAIDNTFTVITQNSKECFFNKPEACHTVIKIFLQKKEYILQQSDAGKPVFISENKILAVPGSFKDLRIEVLSNFIIVLLDLVGVKIKWDGKQLVQVEVENSLWNKTAGLCGMFDGDISNDMLIKDGTMPNNIITLASNWQVDSLGETCNVIPTYTHSCTDTTIKGSKGYNAIEFCKQILFDKRFSLCQKMLDIRLLLDACLWDYCSCKYTNPEICACETLNVYVRECFHKGITSLITWRDRNFCPMHCTGGKVYMLCAPLKGQTICGDISEKLEEEVICEEGCYCPEGTYLHDSKCVTREACPCKYHGKEYASGFTIPKDCNTCTCSDGKWICTEVLCVTRCSIIGDPHYVTFDGKSFDFMGKCTYYLVQHKNFTIEMENIACGGAITQGGSLDESSPSCPKSVTVQVSDYTVKIQQGRSATINGMEITKIPYYQKDFSLRLASSMFLIMELFNGIQVWWDGVSRAHVDLPPEFIGETKGLCGTFNKNQKDDFLTPEGDIEHTITAFANKWKTSEKCGDISEAANAHPCDVNIQNKAAAEEHCKVIKSQIFSDCFNEVDPERLYANCLYDVCACKAQISKCLCPILAAYAEECARKGINIYWRNNIRQCGVHCPTGQIYQVCGNSCTRSCYDIVTLKNCQRQCVEGCNCPEGETLDENGECIPIGQCNCVYNGLEFLPRYKEIRLINNNKHICACTNARWICKPATQEEIKKYPQDNGFRDVCNSADNKEFTTCEPAEPKTCKSMHIQESFSSAVCHPGCKCKSGYVLDTYTQKCIQPYECPCHHGGRSYSENATLRNDCNHCICKDGKWKCSNDSCPRECSVWGESHFKTFDGRLYNFQGQCDYMLVKGSIDENLLDISIQNVPCSSLGVSCSKSITIKVENKIYSDRLTLTQDKEISQSTRFKHLIVRQKDHFVIVESPELGIVLRWDKGTRVYVKLDLTWKNQVKGLCGNYNDNELDDFQTPSGGLSEVSALLFGDSWRLHPYCPEALNVNNTCDERPERKIWALKQCGLLKSSVFSECHTEVPFESYYDNCLFDACACDGGNCECVCTALSAYAQECSNKGVHIKWRTPDLCPMQCDKRCAFYSPCVSTCSIETCDNIFDQIHLTKMCKQDTCIEGCEVKECPPDLIYSNSSLLECIPKSVCKPFCLEIRNKKYFEGDLIEEDECHTCLCSKGKKVCQGQPCIKTLPVTPYGHEPVKCVSGWTNWINQNAQPIGKVEDLEPFDDVEPLPDALIMNNLKGMSKCTTHDMVNIECRTVKDHLSPKETGLNVECSLERGLVCISSDEEGSCVDFEIKVECLCGKPTASSIVPTSGACDILNPFMENPFDCQSYIFCEKGANGPALITKECEDGMLFNPTTLMCDSAEVVINIKPRCEEFTVEVFPTAGSRCPSGQKYHSCSIQCNQLCMYYSYVVKFAGYCLQDQDCQSGCTLINKQESCPEGMLWANNETCVFQQDCMCISYAGKPVKPGGVIKESECETCQCIDNFYTCDTSSCVKSTISETTETEHGGVMVVTPVSTVTPPPECSEKNFINLVDGEIPLSDSAFNASSTYTGKFVPKFARFSSTATEESGGSWVSKLINKEQYLQIDLGRQEPIYGVIVKGNPLHDKYVTSYMVYYSTDRHNFNHVRNYKKEPQIFRGSFDQNSPVKEMFEVPIEAQIIRINPQTWHNGIALRVELLGCKELETTVTIVTMPPTLMCNDDMGVDNEMMADQQISVSSELRPAHTKHELKSSSRHGWQPLTNSPSEWVQFDFTQPRNITGFVSQGGANGWVTAFKVKYSHDEKHWNPILNFHRIEQLFPGNIDKNTRHMTKFDVPVQTRFLRIIPLKWYNNIQLRLEPKGCFIPYSLKKITKPERKCNNCVGDFEDDSSCICEGNMWWNGTACVLQAECPCSFGHMLYPIGSVFIKEDCVKCTCTLGGVSRCSSMSCNKCENEELQSVLTNTCECICQPCDYGAKLCPTTNICINETLWCNGVQDCPDDETGCEFTTPLSTGKPHEACPKPKCPPGYIVKFKNYKKSEYLHTMFALDGRNEGIKKIHHKYTTKGGIKTGVKGSKKKPQTHFVKHNTSLENECREFECIFGVIPEFPGVTPEPCPEVVCPLGYTAEKDYNNKEIKNCPKFICKAITPPDAVCNVTGQTFNTFDFTEFKYDICNHILARDLVNNNWEVILQKNCTEMCTRYLVINLMEHVFVIYPDLTIVYNGYKYTVEHTEKIGSHSKLFAIAQLGDSLVFVSNKYGFWVIWNNQENVKVGVTRRLLRQVDGLCGYFDDDARNDKRNPDMTLAKTTEEFGSSWFQSVESIACEPQICPTDIQKKAYEICSVVREQIFASCSGLINLDAYISSCMESVCKCLKEGSDKPEIQEKCKCLSIQNFVVDCLAADSDLNLIDWRMRYNCPSACEPPLVHYDCYKRVCEPSCGALGDQDVCPKSSHFCFPGCYCPPGYVRKGNSCILPVDCHVECNLSPHLDYVTYDGKSFIVNGNCTYIMSQDVIDEINKEHKFQVLITNLPCDHKSGKMCVGQVNVLHKNHHIQIKRDMHHKKLKLIIDSMNIFNTSEATKEWLDVNQTSTKHIRILLKEIQVLVSVYYPSMGVSVEVPLLKFDGKLEGLCSYPNKDIPLTDEVSKFALEWVYGTPEYKEQCVTTPPFKCSEEPFASDPCLQLEDIAKYGQCHPVLDPSMFIDWCRKDICNGSPQLSCDALAAYSRECANLGFCIDWHNELCPPEECPLDQEFRPCGPKCPQTCEAVKETDEKCSNPPIEGCFCPEGKVFFNGSCVYSSRCDACDNEGHQSGDVWKIGECTTCACEGTSMKCETETCPSIETICEEGYAAIKVPAENECCDKYRCVQVLVKNVTCPSPQEIQCAEGQIMKLIKTADGCQKFVCECKPIEDCEPIDTVTSPTVPYIERIIDTSGCCPIINEICNPELCYEPEPCNEYYLLEAVNTTSCCPDYICSLPKDSCIAELYYSNETEEESARRVLKKFNETWQDGPCRKCTCISDVNGESHNECSTIKCPDHTKSADYEDYILEAQYEVGICCPTIHRMACKHNGKVYELGKVVTLEENPCMSIECVQDFTGRLLKLLKIHSCETNCELGWEYVSPNEISKQCCGSCKPVACVIDDEIYDIGESWTSLDYCTNYKCTLKNGSLHVESVTTDCPPIPVEITNEYVVEAIPVEGKCCRTYRTEACIDESRIYKAGETWSSKDDRCRITSCIVNDIKEVVKVQSMETCNTDCARGWEYKASDIKCCGKCVQVACVEEDKLRYPDEVWTSSDNCTTYTCEMLGDQLTIVSLQQSCPNIDYCRLENIYSDGCCKYCNISKEALVTCEPKEIELNSTINLFSYTSREYGLCENDLGVKGFTECVGTCSSYTFFNRATGLQDSMCKCCQAIKYEPFPVTLNCEAGNQIKHSFPKPSECNCHNCGESHAKNGHKIGAKHRKRVAPY